MLLMTLSAGGAMSSVSVVSTMVVMVLLLLLLSRRCDGEDVYCALNDIFDENVDVVELEGVWSARKVYAYLDDEATSSYVNYQARLATSDNGNIVDIHISSLQTADASQCRKLDYTFTKQADLFLTTETIGGTSVPVALVFTAVSTIENVGRRALIYICVVPSAGQCLAHTALLIYNNDELQSGTVDWMDGLTAAQLSCIRGNGAVVDDNDHDCVLDSGAERCVHAQAALMVTIILCLSDITRLPVFSAN